MRTTFITLLFIMITISGCKKTNQKQSEAIESQTEQESKVTEIDISKENDSGIVNIDVVSGHAEVFVHKKENQTIYLEFLSSGYKKLHGTLSSEDDTANIRFSQIFMPDGTMDGPFGREIEYDLLLDGTYRLSVHENMMAGDPWEGNFKVSLQLNK